MPASGRPTVPGSTGSSARAAVRMSVSVSPYRSRTASPVSRCSRAWSTAVSAAEPETSSRARPTAAAAAGSVASSSARRWYWVGTPKTRVAPASTAAASADAANVPRWCSAPPRRSGPSTPSTSPCTWNSGRAWASRSSAVQSQASASASRFAATAAAGQHGALRRPGGPGGVDDQRRSGSRQVGIDVSHRSRVPTRGGSGSGGRSASGAGRSAPGAASTALGRRVGDDVRQLARAAARVDRHRRHARRAAPRRSRRRCGSVGVAYTATRSSPAISRARAPARAASSG